MDRRAVCVKRSQVKECHGWKVWLPQSYYTFRAQPPPPTVGGDQEDTLTAHSCIHALGPCHALHHRARLVLCILNTVATIAPAQYSRFCPVF